jgi:DNA-binding NtrC family response regulator
MKNPFLAVIEDDEDVRELILAFFRPKNFKVSTFSDAQSFLKSLEKEEEPKPSVIITDLMLPKMDGIELVKKLKEMNCESPVIVLTAEKSAETAIRAIEAGAYDFVVKPMNFPQLQVSVERALHFGGIREENKNLKEAISMKQSSNGIIGRSPGLKRAVDLARRVADSSANVFISGETGTGKEVIAKAVHDLGHRAGQPFIAINCSAIPENLLESELFGHAKGSFTGASEKKIGLFEEAGEGTLFLDEVGDLSLPLQAKLLRTLQERKIKRIGENQFRPISARIISATHKNLPQEIKDKNFREDLFFRLNVIPIHIPPLRERREDILPLAEFFLKKFSVLNAKPRIKGFDKGAIEYLLRSPWQGNVRELENSIERAVVLSDSEYVGAADFCLEGSPRAESGKTELAAEIPAVNFATDGRFFSVDISQSMPTLEELTSRYIEFAVQKNEGAKDKTAKELGIDRKTLYRKLLECEAARAPAMAAGGEAQMAH